MLRCENVSIKGTKKNKQSKKDRVKMRIEIVKCQTKNNNVYIHIAGGVSQTSRRVFSYLLASKVGSTTIYAGS